MDFLHLIDIMTNTPVYFKTRSEILTNGDEKFQKLFEVLRGAEKFIHLEYFIIHEGEIASELKEILIDKSLAGIEVRVLYDDFGCVDMSLKYINELREAGVGIHPFNPVTLRMMNDPFNYRNHRKIVVVDGNKGFTGGINIGDEYNHKDEYYGFWRDTHVYLEGDAIRSMNLIFASDWEFTTGESLREEKYLHAEGVNATQIGGVQIVGDGPEHDMTVIKNMFFKAICEAEERIIIQTPYLIPDYDIIKAIQIASLSGVDVKILVPGKPDKNKDFVYKATQSYFEDFLRVGCEIYTYDDHFMHSKVIIVDDKFATVGTANLDFISLNTNFEVVAVLYFNSAIKKLIEDFEEDLRHSTKVETEEWLNRPYIKRFGETLARLLSPIM
jgi:cardiolipin synthase